MIIPFDRIDPETLTRLIEEYVTREGTDYGMVEFSLEDKVTQLRLKLESGEVVIVFDPATEAINLILSEAS